MISQRLIIDSSLVTEPLDLLYEYIDKYSNKKIRQRLYFLIQVKRGFINNDNIETIAGIMGVKTNVAKNWFREYLTKGLKYYVREDTKGDQGDIVMDGAIRIKHIKEGRACAACGIYFEHVYGRPTVCKSCVDWYNYGRRKFPRGLAIADE